MRKTLYLLLLILFFSGCSTPHMRLPESLQGNAEMYVVQGRDGWRINQQISFSEFRAGPVARGWTKGYDYPFLIRFSAAREKFQFPMVDQYGGKVQVFCFGKLREQDLRIFKDYFDINLHATDTFTCSISSAPKETYDFYVSNLNLQQNVGYKPMQGSLRGGAIDYQLRSIWHLDSGHRTLDTQPLGVEFSHNGRAIAAVETINEGRVWLHKDLSQSARLVVAAAASALLLRSGLAEHNDNNDL